MSSQFIIVDTRSLVTLAKAFQSGEGLDLLFRDGRKIIILPNAIAEALAGPNSVVQLR
jgi:hypothetical protein